ncbi:MAG: SGNH/GDSL hydrolase family protein [Leptonema sp. (in: bacteria)]
MGRNGILQYKMFFPLLLWILILFACDRKKSFSDIPLGILECQLKSNCNTPSTYGMIGDSWTDFVLGYPIVEDLYDQLTSKGYKITASNIGGLTLKFELEQRRGFLKVIHDAGPELEFFLLSIGGNDLIFPVNTFSIKGIDSTIQERVLAIKKQLKELVFYGNQYKTNLYGGKPIKWIIHGYDYPNPEFDDSCIIDAITYGMSPEQAKTIYEKAVNQLNIAYWELTLEIPNFYYIDLRRSLGGPPYSNSNFMYDCIHPNTLGFSLLVESYINQLKILEKL